MNVLHYYSGNWRAQSDNHSIVGYDRQSDQIEYTLSIPKSKRSLLHKFVQFGSDDPNGYDSYKLPYSKVSNLVHLLGGAKPPKNLEYFVEYNVTQKHEVR